VGLHTGGNRLDEPSEEKDAPMGPHEFWDFCDAEFKRVLPQLKDIVAEILTKFDNLIIGFLDKPEQDPKLSKLISKSVGELDESETFRKKILKLIKDARIASNRSIIDLRKVARETFTTLLNYIKRPIIYSSKKEREELKK
jgi:hypothetical protein